MFASEVQSAAPGRMTPNGSLATPSTASPTSTLPEVWLRQSREGRWSLQARSTNRFSRSRRGRLSRCFGHTVHRRTPGSINRKEQNDENAAWLN